MKTGLTIESASRYLRHLVGEIEGISPMVEGEESQAFAFTMGSDRFVLRVGDDLAGYEKDAYACRTFASLPIPEITQTGWLDPDHAYSISRFCDGITLQDAAPQIVDTLMPSLTTLWSALAEQPVKDGYGRFGTDGIAPHPSWRAFLEGGLTLPPDCSPGQADLLGEIRAEIIRLLPLCPEEHSLVHGDFGSNNVLIDPHQPVIEGLIDWDCAMYGDALFDIATAHFWRTWLPCMEISSRYWETHLADLPHYHARIRCYSLWTGFNEIAADIAVHERAMIPWLEHRCRQILDHSNR